jgi:hypothetical protein
MVNHNLQVFHQGYVQLGDNDGQFERKLVCGLWKSVGIITWQIETHLFGNFRDMVSTICQGEKL